MEERYKGKIVDVTFCTDPASDTSIVVKYHGIDVDKIGGIFSHGTLHDIYEILKNSFGEPLKIRLIAEDMGLEKKVDLEK